MKRRILLALLTMAVTSSALLYMGGASAQESDTVAEPGARGDSPATTTPQTLPFSQNWTNTGQITTDDDWSGVPGIVGYRGDGLAAATAVDPRTILADGSTTPVDVNANRNDPGVFTTGGVAEFEIADPVVAFQGSGTGRAPHLVIYLNTTGQSNIRVQFNARDIDNQTADAVQPVNTQYRVGGSGNYINVPGGFIADASSGASQATLVTPVDVTLPAAANNQPLVEVRIMTTDAIGSDEFIGIDDINITTAASPARANAAVDFNGDLKTDFSVVRGGVPTAPGSDVKGEGAAGPYTWYTLLNGPNTVTGVSWGINPDIVVTEDFDGDNRSDITVWRPGVQGRFYIIRSSTGTADVIDFGQNGDDPRVVGDYDGDGKADLAIYREGASAGQPSHWWYRRSTVGGPGCSAPGACNDITFGQNGDVPAPGDYDGDGKNDFVVRRPDGGGNARFWMLTAAGVASNTQFGGIDDLIVPGDWDGDGKTDIAVARDVGGVGNWFWRPSSGGSDVQIIWGDATQDEVCHGDYDGDGKTDACAWRNGVFLVRGSASGPLAISWGAAGDYTVATFNTHGN